MSLSCQELREQGVLKELAETFKKPSEITLLVTILGIPEDRLPRPESYAPLVFWSEVCFLLQKGLVAGLGPQDLARAAAKLYPGNAVFEGVAQQSSRRSEQAPRGNRQAIRIYLPREYGPGDLEELHQRMQQIDEIRATIAGGGLPVELDLVTADEVTFSVAGATAEQANSAGQAVVEQLRQDGIDASFEREDNQIRVYYLDPLYVEGPDQQRFELSGIEATQRVRDIIDAVMGEYSDDFFPPDQKTGAPRRAVIDRRNRDGSHERLHPDAILHEAGVRPGDTLMVSPEARAGAVNPQRQFEAMVMVSEQMRAFADAHPDVLVDVDDPELPTEYLLRFSAPSFAPGPTPDQPRPTEHHEVLLYLPPDFPIYAPQAFWQTPIFHPNVAPFRGKPEDGVVCLGDLQDSYRPGLHIGRVCNMLLDMAAYRTYVLHEGYNPEAAAWVKSATGQQQIADIGGRRPEDIYGATQSRRRPISVRRRDS